MEESEKTPERLKKIVLVTCASNFERHKNIISAIHRKLKEKGGFVFYVLTNYGVYKEQTVFGHGEPAIYSFLDQMEVDGCIIEANLGSALVMDFICEKIKKRGIPAITINIENEGIPFICMNSYTSGRHLIEHMIDIHHCKKINLVLNEKQGDIISANMLKACRDVFAERNLPFEETRVYRSSVGIPNGRQLFHTFQEEHTQDADAVIMVHDVLAIGYELEMEKNGLHVPEDMLLCSLNRSANSMVFRPEITGVDRLDDKVAASACELLDKMIRGEEVPMENYYSGEVSFGESCGCKSTHDRAADRVYQQMIITKVSSGDQVRSMMEFNGDLEDVDTVEQLAENIKTMMRGIGIDSFYCCFNRDDRDYIIHNTKDIKNAKSAPYDENMLVVTGVSERTGELKNYPFPRRKVVPVKPKEGDLFVLFPIHHKERDYGYMVFLNEYLPVEVYNYRICHESLGISIENLHKQMILKRSIEELDRLHMVDQMTGLYNRFAISRFKREFTQNGRYSVVMIDMDGLKVINDTYGHLAGNNAICTTSNTIRRCMDKDDLIIRYGGDEFVVLSKFTDADRWIRLRENLNSRLQKSVEKQKLPYQLGVSLGFAVVNSGVEKIDLETALQTADREMYEDKKRRKAGRD